MFAVEKLVTSKLHERSVNQRISTIDRHVGVVSCREWVWFRAVGVVYNSPGHHGTVLGC